MKAKKIIIISLVALGLLTGVYFIIRSTSHNASALAKKTRRIIIVRKKKEKTSNATGSESGKTSSGVIGGLMTLKVIVPALQENFYSTSDVTLNKKALDTIETKYGAYIKNVAKLTNVKEDIIKAFIYVESGGNPNAVSYIGCCYGLMQIAPESASLGLWMENDKGRLSDSEKALIKKYIPNINYNNSKTSVTKTDLFNPELNILIGSILIGYMIDKETAGTVIKLEHVIVRYHAGFYTYYTFNSDGTVKDEVGKKPAGDAAAVCKARTSSCDYIKKILGVNGLLETMM